MSICVLLEIGVPKNHWFLDDSGVPDSETSR